MWLSYIGKGGPPRKTRTYCVVSFRKHKSTVISRVGWRSRSSPRLSDVEVTRKRLVAFHTLHSPLDASFRMSLESLRGSVFGVRCSVLSARSWRFRYKHSNFPRSRRRNFSINTGPLKSYIDKLSRKRTPLSHNAAHTKPSRESGSTAPRGCRGEFLLLDHC